MKVKEESKKPGLTVNIQKMKIMTPGPIPSWQMCGKTMERVTDFIFLGSKITADGDCSHEIIRCLVIGEKKSCDQAIQHVKKKRHYFANRSPSNPGYGFSSSHMWM